MGNFRKTKGFRFRKARCYFQERLNPDHKSKINKMIKCGEIELARSLLKALGSNRKQARNCVRNRTCKNISFTKRSKS